MLKFIDFRFTKPYTQLLDTSKGIERARWCVGAETNFVLNCIDRHRGTPTWRKTYLVWEGEDGRVTEHTYAQFDAEVTIDAASLSPYVTWGTNPGQGLPLNASVPSPDDAVDEIDRVAIERALEYMGLTPGTPLKEVAVDTVFVGSCTNGRIEDLRAVAEVLKGRRVADGVRMLIVPGSVRVRLQAEEERLDDVFLDAGAEWREAGCSMCLAMNPDKLAPGERSASTSNRNFEGRQGPGGRTHLVSPAVAAATAVTGRLTSPADLSPVG